MALNTHWLLSMVLFHVLSAGVLLCWVIRLPNSAGTRSKFTQLRKCFNDANLFTVLITIMCIVIANTLTYATASLLQSLLSPADLLSSSRLTLVPLLRHLRCKSIHCMIVVLSLLILHPIIDSREEYSSLLSMIQYTHSFPLTVQDIRQPDMRALLCWRRLPTHSRSLSFSRDQLQPL